MKLTKIITFILAFTYTSIGIGQTQQISFVVLDQVTDRPIKNVHAFINNATFGATTNDIGQLRFAAPYDLRDELILSHIGYDTKILTYSQYNNTSDSDTIYLNANGINIDEVLVVEKRGKKWKKNFKKFNEAFLGDGKEASECAILNPEVLRFSIEDGTFKATAIDLLKIRNDYLGYEIDFLLSELVIDAEGSKKYIGHAKFNDQIDNYDREKIEINRNSEFLRSTRHFFYNLIHNSLDANSYKFRLVKYINGEFREQSTPKPNQIVFLDSLSGLYHIIFGDFLEVTHLGLKQIVESNLGVRSGGLESSRFNSSQTGPSTRIQYPISYLYKLGQRLIVNKYGTVINQKMMEEYGFWADQRMATMLPLDFGMDFHKSPLIQESTSIHSESKNEQEQIHSSLIITQNILSGDAAIQQNTFEYIEQNWKLSYVPVLLDILNVSRDPVLHGFISTILATKLGITSYYDGLEWMFSGDGVYDTLYGNVKAEIYQYLDPKFKIYFQDRQKTALVNLDEIVWGGVAQDGIPPLRIPKMIPSEEAGYLEDNHIVFGIYINGDAQAFPKRILAWHELFIAKIGNENIAGVYCTLCGSMIAYDMVFKDQIHDLGTSGFLYKSNKLMYDRATQSLWSTIEGIPILGPLAGKGIRLKSYPVVTTTWGKWKEKHPDTKVLSLETGHDRNYAEGEAYKNYFSSQQLMFPVPILDNRLKNKDEVFVLRAYRFQDDPLAISVKRLRKKKIIQDEIIGRAFVALADKKGSIRAYFSKNTTFKSYKKEVLKDKAGNVWTVTEDTLQGPKGEILERIPGHNVFWFAWFNAYPDTRLIK